MPGRTCLPTCALLAAAAVALVGVVALLGWTFDVDAGKRLLPGAVAMNPATAVLLLLAAVSLLLHIVGSPIAFRPLAARLLAAIVLAGGLLRLCEYGFGFDVGFDGWLFRDHLQGNVIAPNTALNFALVGLALLLLASAARPAQRLSQLAALVAALVTLLAVIGYGYNVGSLYGVGSFIPMAPNTTLAFALLIAGIFCARPERGLIALLTSPTTGGLLARLLLPTAVILPALFGWLWLQAERAGVLPSDIGAAIYAVANIVVLGLIIGLATRLMDRNDIRRRATQDALAASERRYRQLTEASLDAIVVADRLGRIIIFNPMAETMFGYPAADILGEPLERLMPVEFRERHRQGIERYVKAAVRISSAARLNFAVCATTALSSRWSYRSARLTWAKTCSSSAPSATLPSATVCTPCSYRPRSLPRSAS